MNENSSTAVNTIHMKAKCSNHEFDRDTETSGLLIANYCSFVKIFIIQNMKNKPPANGFVFVD